MYLKLLTTIALCVTLAGCKSQEEQAEEYFQSALELVEAGDQARAIVEFQNVFQLNENHTSARMAFANLLLERRNISRAYGHLLRVAEQNPDEVEPRIKLAQIAFKSRQWDEFSRHGQVAVEKAPELDEVVAISLGLRYQQAVINEEFSQLEGIALQAEEALTTLPADYILRNILIDTNVRKSDIPAAIEHVDFLISQGPEEKELYDQKLALIAKTQNSLLVEEHLLLTVDRFPDDVGSKSSLLRLYMSERSFDKAEDFLRLLSKQSPEDPAPLLDLIRFLSEVHGPETARAEIERGIAESPDPVPFRALRAGLNFSNGDEDAAIQEMEDVISTSGPSEHLSGVKIALARMLLSTENEVGARRLVEEVLVEDLLNTDALKMQSAWQIEADNTDGAIATLRSALDIDPDDVKTNELLATAYDRAGSPELALEYLARAVDSSGNAPEQSLRYASALMSDERYLPAEDTLIPALRLSPGNPQLLAALGRLYLLMDDSPRTTQVIDTLKRIDTGETRQIANALRAEQLQREGGVADAVKFLETVNADGAAGLNAQMLLLRGRLANGDSEGALNLIETLIKDNPSNDRLPIALAAVKGAVGDLEGAAGAYNAILSENPNQPRVWLELSRVLLRSGDKEGADAAIENGLKVNLDDPNLLWARASVLEQDNKIEDAIAIYEQLYARSSNSIIIANNLASLLSARRDDQESLDRAFVVARRFKDTETPALQDTYGWILHRKGQTEEALPYLESAAFALDRDALTQFHLAMAYIALDERNKAIAQLQKTIDVAGPVDTRPQIEQARSELARLQNETE